MLGLSYIPQYKFLDNFNLSHQLIDKGYNDLLVYLINTTSSVLQSSIIFASISYGEKQTRIRY